MSTSDNAKRKGMGKIIENYALQEIIGEGMYGKVYKAIHLRTKEEFAVKVIPIVKFQENPKLEECTVNEINILSTIESSPYIIRYVEMLKTPNNFYFIYEYCNDKTLENLLKTETRLSEQRALKIFRQLLEAFKILNKYNIMHRDLKPDNIFFHNGNLKLGDFGFCKTLGKSSDMASTMLGSPIYMAPEVLKGEIYTSKADIWSLGVVLFQMLFGYCPFESNSIAKLISVLEETELKFNLEVNPISSSTQNLLKKLLVKDQFKRIDWFQLLQYNISEQGNIAEKKGNEGKLEELKEILSQKQIQTYNGSNGSDHSKPDEFVFKKKPDQASTGSGSKPSHPMSNGINSSTSSGGSAFQKPKPISTFDDNKQIPTYQPYDFNASKGGVDPNSYGSPQLAKKGSMPAQYNVMGKRRTLLEQHMQCAGGIKLALAFMRAQDTGGVPYSVIIFNKVLERMRKISGSIAMGDIENQDILYNTNNEIKLVERMLTELRDEVHNTNQADLNQLENDHKGFLKGKYQGKSENVLRLWSEMVYFLKGERPPLKEQTIGELSLNINSYLV